MKKQSQPVENGPPYLPIVLWVRGVVNTQGGSRRVTPRRIHAENFSGIFRQSEEGMKQRL
jgi:hypothetical protein